MCSRTELYYIHAPKNYEEIGFRVLAGEYQKHKQAYESVGLRDTPPYQLLAFGYQGTGAQCLSTFLASSGFKNSDVENIQALLKRRADGSQILGTERNDLIEWEDGSETPSIRTPEKKWWQFWT